VINNVDDALLMSLAVTCDQQRCAVKLVIYRVTLFCGRLTDCRMKRCHPSVRPTTSGN